MIFMLLVTVMILFKYHKVKIKLKNEVLRFCNSYSSFSESYASVLDDPPENITFAEKIKPWACSNRSSRIRLKQLIVILWENWHPDLPKDARTLLKSPRTFSSTQKCGGEYTYLGIEKDAKKVIEYHGIERLANKIKLNINVDVFPFLSILVNSYGRFWKCYTPSHHLL